MNKKCPSNSNYWRTL